MDLAERIQNAAVVSYADTATFFSVFSLMVLMAWKTCGSILQGAAAGLASSKWMHLHTWTTTSHARL